MTQSSSVQRNVWDKAIWIFNRGNRAEGVEVFNQIRITPISTLGNALSICSSSKREWKTVSSLSMSSGIRSDLCRVSSRGSPRPKIRRKNSIRLLLTSWNMIWIFIRRRKVIFRKRRLPFWIIAILIKLIRYPNNKWNLEKKERLGTNRMDFISNLIRHSKLEKHRIFSRSSK